MSKDTPTLKSIRDGFGQGLMHLASNPQVVALSADLSESVRMEKFATANPDRYIEVGIAEQNMAGIATGLAFDGFIPFIGSFACFQPMRNLDQIRTSICIPKANVKIVSSHAGFSHPSDGVQIQALEDIAIMRTLPNTHVIVPADFDQAVQLTNMAAEVDGPVYLRLGRGDTELLFDWAAVDKEIITPVELGKAQRLRAGSDATIVATGYMVAQALKAALVLAERGVHVTVLNMHTIKPLDTESIVQAAEMTRAIITVEEHQKHGGLGGAVAEVLAQTRLPVPLTIIGVDDKFGISATSTADLWQQYGLTVEDIVQAVLASIDAPA